MRIDFPAVGNPKEIHLRPATVADAEPFVKWMSNPKVAKTLISSKRKFTIDGQKWQIESMYKKDPPRRIIYGIWFADTLIGRLKFSRIRWEKSSTYTSSLLDPMYWGRGFGSKAGELRLELSKRFGFKVLKATIQKSNIANLKIHEKLGYTISDESSPNHINLTTTL